MDNTTQKRVILMMGCAVFIVAAGFFVAEKKNKNKETLSYEAQTPVEVEELINNQSADTDKDGLKDWEEVLLGTNPDLSDTDMDGTNDGKEVEIKRNPLVKGPNDKEKSKEELGEKITPIDMFARNFFARYMELRQAGISSDKISQDDLANTVIQEGVIISLPKSYSENDLTKTKQYNEEYIQKYIGQVDAVFRNNQNLGKDESVIAKESVEKENPEILKQIDPIIKTYKNVISGLTKIVVPEEFGGEHLKMVNAMSGFLFVAESLRKTDKDALVALQGASRQLDYARELSESLSTIRSYKK